MVHANVTPLLDYCNCLLVGLPSSLTDMLQRVQNCAARVVKQVKQREHITPVLKELHWLPIRFRIQYKVNLLTFKALHELAPEYLRELIQLYQPPRSLRSQNCHLLTVPSSKLRSFGGRAFSNSAPELWNKLPMDIRTANSLPSFKSKLKTHYFKLAFYN